MESDEFDVGNSDDLLDGQMKQVEAGGEKVLLARIDGKIHAVQGVCPHYGGPLAEGTLCGKHVRCPWHQACFDVTSGELLEPPAMESLQRYESAEHGGKIYVRLTKPSIAPAIHVQPSDPHFVILGAGAAGLAAAQKLPEVGFAGRVSLISHEAQLPYDRPALSKNYLSGLPPIMQWT